MASPTSGSFFSPRKPLASTISAGSAAWLQDSSLDELTGITLEEMAAAWHAGRPLPAERWLERNPALLAGPQAAVRIIFEEVCLREEQGEQVESDEIMARFPQWKSELEIVLDCHRLMQSQAPTATFPEAPARLGELELLRELGRGGQGRVFLATQPSLSDRPLVVKLTARAGSEHLSLARLQHTHIAPLYLVQDFPDENLRALCMPYLGGASWSQVLQTLRPLRMRDRRGRDMVAALDAARFEAPASVPSGGPALGFLARASYVEAVCWIGSSLADALHYAHQRGLVHLDVKPSNVLLAGDGQPMLLDFHLARDVVPTGHSAIDRLGGTRGYMSPEQELAAAAVRGGRRLEMPLDGRSDIFSLGVLLYESLAGTLPPGNESASRRAAREANPDVSRGLEDIVHKCLARDPAARYADASQLAADLRCHLAGLPLRGVPNRSRKERWQKWRRRNPHALVAWSSGLLAAAVVATTATVFYQQRTRDARLALAASQHAFENRDYAAVVDRAASGADALRWLPWQGELRQTLDARLTAGRHAQLVAAVHKLVEQLGYVDGAADLPAAKVRKIEAACQAIWQVRRQLAPSPGVAASTDSNNQLQTDLLDLALLWSRMRLRVATADQRDSERRAAVQVLDEVQRLCGPSPVVEYARNEYASASGAASAKETTIPDPRTAWEHRALGRLLFHAGKIDQAKKQFEQAIRLQPDGFWQNFYATLCAYRLEDFQEALTSASVCVALAPKSPECYHNRALCHQALGHDEEALADFRRASDLDPSAASQR